MMLDPEARSWFDSIKSTPLRDRIFVLMLFMIFIAIGYSAYITVTLSNEKNDERNLRVKAERELVVQQNNNLKDNKDCNTLILQAKTDCEEKWQAKFENERMINQKFLEDKASKLEQELQYLRNETRKVKIRTENMRKNTGL